MAHYKEVKGGGVSDSLNFSRKKDMLFTQMFQNIFIQAPPGDPGHNNCCNYSNLIRCERSLLCLAHSSSSR